ncbi:phosphoglycolate phosphatase [Mumia flava]|uniref:Phosphoglycolate phosphatase n=1 Tax=Mumia flava TaxID=1348852 RepID=A0A0B2BEI2_9ACTN|nr:haloacid dehalogenase-like hydrolase [Mumia flava]PJJ56976.1 phosphoglycolate phosphatase [Mumia flava]
MSTVPAVGFDLDMTLIDSRPGIKAVYVEIARRTGVPIDADLVVSRLGPPVELEMAHWFAEDEVEQRADEYRALYPAIAVDEVEALPGAHAAFDDVRARGARVVVITAKNEPHARLHLDRLGLVADEVRGRAWRGGKADVLREVGALAYVGDHEHDMEAAVTAEVAGIGVTTGPCDAESLRAAGAQAVLASLEDLPARLDALWSRPAVS